MISHPLPESFQTLISLFKDTLRFPGVDAEVLRGHAAEVADAEAAVKAAEQALDAARTALHERTQAALARGERALSYLRVFAADDETLAAQLAELTLLPSPSQQPPPPRRPRAKKPEPELFGDDNLSQAAPSD